MSGEEEIYYEPCDTRAEIILQCYNSLSAVEMIDPLTKVAQEQKRRIQRNCLKVIDYYVKEIAAEIFDEEDEDN